MTNLIKEAGFLGVSELQNTRQLCQLLMETPYYKKIGQEGIFAIVETAKSLNIDPRLALGGGLYYVKGKVEMTSRLMNSLIRKHGHSITQDERSDDTICILHGRRADTGDTWTESFSIAEAERAGLLKKDGWINFPRDMLFARALSRLARQLFPDVIGNVYVEGEISLDPSILEIPNIIYKKEIDTPSLQEKIAISLKQRKDSFSPEISNKEVAVLESLIGNDNEYRQKVLRFLKNHYLVDSFYDMPKEIYDKVYARALKNKQEREKAIQNTCQQDEINQMAVGDSFGNVIGEGEISCDPNILYTETAIPSLEKNELLSDISNEEIDELEALIGDDDNYRQKVLCFLENNNLGYSFHDMPKEIYDKVYARALKNKQEREKAIQDTCQQDEINQMAMGDSSGNIHDGINQIEGEISFDSNIAAKEAASPSRENKKLPTNISNEEIAALESLIGNDDNYRQKVLCFLENNNLGRSFHDMPKEIYDKVYARALKNKQEREKVIQDTCQHSEINQIAMGDS